MTYTHHTWIYDGDNASGFGDMHHPDYESAEKRVRELIDGLVLRHGLKLNGVEPVRRLTPHMAFWEWKLGNFTVGITKMQYPMEEP